MELPKLYRKVYLIANEESEEDDEYTSLVYIRARLSLDEYNNLFWQLDRDEWNLLNYNFSDLDNYDLSTQWSSHKNPIETNKKEQYKHSPECSRNRLTIKEIKVNSDIPF